MELPRNLWKVRESATYGLKMVIKISIMVIVFSGV